MFDQFGEFDSVEELNLAAEGLLKEGDTDSLMRLAVENGLDPEDAEDYIHGESGQLASLSMAAYGRITMDEKENINKIKNPMEQMAMRTILTVLRGMLSEDTVAAGVMRKGKRSMKILEQMRQQAEKHKSGNMGMCCGTDRELSGIIRAYYTQDAQALEQAVKNLYPEPAAGSGKNKKTGRGRKNEKKNN